MADIFDQIAAEPPPKSKGDIFDQVAQAKAVNVSGGRQDPLTKKAQDTARAAGVSNPGAAPISTKAIDQDFAATQRLHALETKEGNYPTPFSDASFLYGLVEMPELLSRGASAIGSATDRLGSALRAPGEIRTGFPPTSGALRPGVKQIPIVGRVMDAIAPANPKVVTGVGRVVPRAAAPAEALQEAVGGFMNEGYQPADQAATSQAVKEGRAARLPVRMPATEPPATPPDPLALALREGRAARLPVHMPSADKPVDALVQAVREGRAARLPMRLTVPSTSLATNGEIPRSPLSLAGSPLRSGSAGDLASWKSDDLWEGYMKTQDAGLKRALANEISRRGLATTAPPQVRP